MIQHSNSFINYTLLLDRNVNSDLFDVVSTGKDNQIFYGSEPYQTIGKNMITHPSDVFLRAVITDYQLKKNTGSPGFSYFDVLSYKVDILDGNSDPFSDLDQLISNDPFIRIKTTGTKAVPILGPDDPLFAFCFNTISDLIVKINLHTSRMMGELMIDENENHPVIYVVKAGYVSVDKWKKAVIHALFAMHNSGLLLLLGLVNGTINPSEYAKGLVSLKNIKPHEFGQIIREAAEALSFLSYFNENASSINQLQIYQNAGEGDSVEFKSTLRWDIRAGKTNSAIERACLKSIAAFLNSRGGVLLIGVRDDGSIEGIETDKFPNEDKFLLHLWTLIRTCLGRDVSPFIRTVLEKQEDKTACIVTCQASNRPVFLRQPGFEEELYIRLGPSSNAMIISEALTYIKERFPGI